MFKNIILGFSNESLITIFSISSYFLMLKYLILFAAIMTVISTNPIHAVLYLILTFFISSILVISLGAEFLGILLVIVYVGAIAVLFLFIVMMLNIEQESKFVLIDRTIFLLSTIILFILSKIIAIQIYGFSGLSQPFLFKIYMLPFFYSLNDWISILFNLENIAAIGFVLYTYYYQLLFLIGFILLLAMLSSIALTFNPVKEPAKFQNKYEQLSKTIGNSIRLANFR